MRLPRARTICAGLLLLFVVAALSSIRRGDPALFPGRGPDVVTVFLVSNGFHSGLVLPRPDAYAVAIRQRDSATEAVMTRFAHYGWVEVGWGDDGFYRDVPDPATFNWRLALRALFRPGNESVLHVVGVQGDPRAFFAGSDIMTLGLSSKGFAALVSQLERTFQPDADGKPQDLGPGLYGPSLFYRARGTFNLFHLCNHWTADMLDAAGIPVWPVAATLPRGLIYDLKIRSGLTTETPALSVSTGTQ